MIKIMYRNSWAEEAVCIEEVDTIPEAEERIKCLQASSPASYDDPSIYDIGYYIEA